MKDNQLTSADRKQIEKSIQDKYSKVASSPEGLFRYSTGQRGLEALNYDPEIIRALPGAVAASFCGVGNPFVLGPIRKGEAVLDIGCGSGVDTIVAAIAVGPSGAVTGIDVTPEMLRKARENVRLMHLQNITFAEISAERLPFPDASFDIVISNGAFNLIPDKVSALAEAFRVLNPNGQFMIADQILVAPLPKDKKARIKSWSQ